MNNLSVKVNISRATLDDVEGLSFLFDEYRQFYGQESDLKVGRAFLSEKLKNDESIIFVARSADVMIGFTQLYPLFSSTRLNRLWLLNDLYVAPVFRGSKVSVSLLDAAKKLARETNSAGLILETEKSNETANNLYRRENFFLDNDHNYYSWRE